MTPEQVEQQVLDSNEALVKHKVLTLTVEVNTVEEADEIMCWMYAKSKPMKSALLEIAWDKVTVSKKVADAIESLRLAF